MLSTMFRNGKPTLAHKILITLNRIGDADTTEINDLMNTTDVFSFGSLYPAIKKLEGSGLIAACGKTQGIPGGPFRYDLTWRGRDLAQTLERIS